MQTIKPRARYLREHDLVAVRCETHWVLGRTLDDAIAGWRNKVIRHVTGAKSDFLSKEARRA
jgi:hypothetical protein